MMFRWSLIVIPNYRATEFVRQRVRLILLIERGLDTWLQYLILVALFLLLWRLIQAPGTCDFENGLCGYTHDQISDFEWTNNTGVTTSFNTGPLGDHTTGSGQALQQIYVEQQVLRRQPLLLAPFMHRSYRPAPSPYSTTNTRVWK